jgi:hypothetical protein
MRYIITESRLEDFIFNWLDTEYGDLEKLKYPEYEEIFLSKDGMFKMSYISRTKRLYVKNEIWDFVRDMFSLDNEETSELFTKWGNNKFGFKAKLTHRVKKI